VKAVRPPPAEPPPLDPDLVQRGGFLFLDPRISGDGSRACATCHGSNPKRRGVYKGAEPAEPGDPEARVAPVLRGLFQTEPFLWDGSAGSVPEVVDRMLAVEMRGGKLDAVNKKALEAYLLSLRPFDNGRIETDGVPSEPNTKSMLDGFEVFKREGCDGCHKPPTFAIRGLRFDVGTGGKFSVPSLRGMPAEGPFGHDGRWATLEDAMKYMLERQPREKPLTYRDTFTLMEYLKLM
jgi:cytochrome c peroxidase